MKATISWAGAVLTAVLASSQARADDYFPMPQQAHSGHLANVFAALRSSHSHTPYYWFRPTGEPLTPFYPAINGLGPYYVTHPYVRGPRDFFMWRENLEDQSRRELRPALVP